jgi:metal transporter CNNM
MTIAIIILLVTMSGLFSGLTLGLLGLNKDELERKIKLNNDESKLAEKVYSVRKNGNLLLCTLLLGNVAVNSVLAIFLGELGSGLMALLLSTSLITLFGEILPQAFVSKHALKIGAKTVFLVKGFQFILYPIVKPLSLFVDWLVGKELPTIYSKKEIVEIIRDHEDNVQSKIDQDEETIVIGALTYSDKIVSSVMTPKSVVYMLDKDTKLTKKLLNEIKDKGHTRVPVYENDNDNIIGVLLTKNLIGQTTGKIVDYVSDDKLLRVKTDTKLDFMLNHFTQHNSHLSVVTDEFGTVVGVVTLEDVIEEIIMREINDETDVHVDMRKLATNG